MVDVLKPIVNTIVRGMLKQDALFTAHDVTREARKYVKFNVQHDAVKDIVHARFVDGKMPGYNRTVVRLPNGAEPFVYYPTTADPSVYTGTTLTQGIRFTGVPTPAVQQVIPPTIPPIPSFFALVSQPQQWGKVATATASNSATSVSVDNRGRVCVPVEATSAMAVKPGDWVYASANGKKIVISKDMAGATRAYTYKVDRSGNVRVSSEVLSKANISANTLTVSWDDKTITIE